MFWMWRHHCRVFWRHGGGGWHNGLFLTKASNVNPLAGVANHVAWPWETGDMANFERGVTGYLWTVPRSKPAQSGDKEFRLDTFRQRLSQYRFLKWYMQKLFSCNKEILQDMYLTCVSDWLYVVRSRTEIWLAPKRWIKCYENLLFKYVMVIIRKW